MVWETIEKRYSCKGPYGVRWKDYPAVSITKGGLTFNQKFCEVFGVHKGGYVEILKDVERRLVGVKILQRDADGGFKVSNNKARKGVSRHITITTLAKVFPDCCNKAFRAHLNSENRIIQIDLSPDNEC